MTTPSTEHAKMEETPDWDKHSISDGTRMEFLRTSVRGFRRYKDGEHQLLMNAGLGFRAGKRIFQANTLNDALDAAIRASKTKSP